MPFKSNGRWEPDEDINWNLRTTDPNALRRQLGESGLDWRHAGKYAFRTQAWEGMQENERFEILQHYDTWFDQGGSLDLDDEKWGLDIERGITYNDVQGWSVLERFHNLTGGDLQNFYSDLTPEEIERRGVERYRDKERGTIVGRVQTDQGEKTLIQRREYPMDWQHYTHDDLYRATIDELMEQDYWMFVGPGSDFDTSVQVRAANREIRSWVDEKFKEGVDRGMTPPQISELINAEFRLQIARGRLTNERYPEGQNSRGFQHNQAVDIKKYRPWLTFDPETGTRQRVNPVTGEVRDTFTHQAADPPVRMTITGDRTLEDVEEGRFFSSTVGLEQDITDSMVEKPPAISKPPITIRQVQNRRPDNIPSDWKLKGDRRLAHQPLGGTP